MVRDDDGPSGNQARVRGCPELTPKADPPRGAPAATRGRRHAVQVYQPLVGRRRRGDRFVRLQRPGARVYLWCVPEAHHGRYWLAARQRVIRTLRRRGPLRPCGTVLGRMMDRWSIRRVALPGLVVYSICLSFVGASPASSWIFTLILALAEMTSAIQTPLGYTTAISAWFDRR